MKETALDFWIRHLNSVNWVEPTKENYPSYGKSNPKGLPWFEDIHYAWRNYKDTHGS